MTVSREDEQAVVKNFDYLRQVVRKYVRLDISSNGKEYTES